MPDADPQADSRRRPSLVLTRIQVVDLRVAPRCSPPVAWYGALYAPTRAGPQPVKCRMLARMDGMTAQGYESLSPRKKRLVDAVTELLMLLYTSAILFSSLYFGSWQNNDHRWPEQHEVLLDALGALLGGAAFWAIRRVSLRRSARKSRVRPQ